MKLSSLSLSSIILFCFIGFSSNASASEVQQNNKTSKIDIEIVPKTLYLTTITPPTFGEYVIDDNGITMSADSDLVINVEDKRDTVKTPWVLYYR